MNIQWSVNVFAASFILSILSTVGCASEVDGVADSDVAHDGDFDEDAHIESDADADFDSDRESDSDRNDATADAETDADEETDSDPCDIVDPYPAQLLDSSGLSQIGWGTIEWLARDGNVLTAYTYRASTFEPVDGPILFVMHGAGRNADGYLDAWDRILDDFDGLGIAPEFPENLYDGSESYNLGVGTDGTPYGDTYDPLEWRDEQDYTHSEIEHLFESIIEALGSNACDYLLYGHSAGGQFVHRLVTFLPHARVRRAVAANAGWYTLPSTGGGGDPNYFMPYGLQGSPPNPDRLPLLFSRELIVLLGEDDTERTDSLRQTAEADSQGLNRLERGLFYYQVASDEADSLGVVLNWSIDTVAGVAHSNSDIAPFAAEHLF